MLLETSKNVQNIWAFKYFSLLLQAQKDNTSPLKQTNFQYQTTTTSIRSRHS